MTSQTIALDANLLVLHVAGRTEGSLIGRHKRLRAYVPHDDERLTGILGRARQVFVTPHVLAESSNLLGQIDEPYRARLRLALRKLVSHVSEQFVVAQHAVQHAVFPQLGLTDAALLLLLRDGHTLLTADHDLHVAATRLRLSSVHFNHLRQGWL